MPPPLDTLALDATDVAKMTLKAHATNAQLAQIMICAKNVIRTTWLHRHIPMNIRCEVSRHPSLFQPPLALLVRSKDSRTFIILKK